MKCVAVLAVLPLAAVATVAQAQYTTDFESPPFNGSAAGTLATGQNGWYRPSGIDQNIHTYDGNALGLAVNPAGGSQFIGGRSLGGTSFARAQIDNNFGAADVWSISYDFAANFNGTLPSAINMASSSLSHPTLAAGFRQFIALNNWTTQANPAGGWTATYNVFNAAGVAINDTAPGPAWQGLLINHWYRQTTVIDFATNRIVEVGITDLTTNTTTTATPDWFMTGGAASTLPRPPSVRFFAGGAAGNIMGWDNLSISIVPTPGAAALLLSALGMGAARRRR